jgi:hypothetical protein
MPEGLDIKAMITIQKMPSAANLELPLYGLNAATNVIAILSAKTSTENMTTWRTNPSVAPIKPRTIGESFILILQPSLIPASSDHTGLTARRLQWHRPLLHGSLTQRTGVTALAPSYSRAD